mmetsp:Transcript_17486/g.36619  ORF Transcript_17486/g.36619 Transcript_17486/m.36619 type:complete len:166 (-) Transcript_17486:71-568(-)
MTATVDRVRIHQSPRKRIIRIAADEEDETNQATSHHATMMNVLRHVLQRSSAVAANATRSLKPKGRNNKNGNSWITTPSTESLQRRSSQPPGARNNKNGNSVSPRRRRLQCEWSPDGIKATDTKLISDAVTMDTFAAITLDIDILTDIGEGSSNASILQKALHKV